MVVASDQGRGPRLPGVLHSAVRRAPELTPSVAGPPLVTGATGFAGGHLLDHLLESEPAVAGWANPHGTPPRASGPRVTWAGVDLLDRGAVTDAIARLRPRAIYHCGGVA